MLAIHWTARRIRFRPAEALLTAAAVALATGAVTVFLCGIDAGGAVRLGAIPGVPGAGAAVAQEELARVVADIVGLAAAAVTAVCVIAVAAVLWGAAAARRREVGLLRALGATRRQIDRILWGETATVVAAGIAAGLGIGAAAGWAIGRQALGRPFPFEPGAALSAAAIVGIAALAAAWAPIRRAAAAAPAESLRNL